MTVLSRIGLLAILPFAAIRSDSGSTPTEPKMTPARPRGMDATVTVGSNSNYFVDSQSGNSTTTIKEGQTVTWAWVGGSHSTTSGTCCTASGVWDSGVMSPGSFSCTFISAGTYPYFCRVQGSLMTGTVVVTSSSDR